MEVGLYIEMVSI